MKRAKLVFTMNQGRGASSGRGSVRCEVSTVRGGVGERLSFLTGMLSEATAFLGSAEDAPRVRALRAQVRFYEQMVARWATTAPTSAQLQTAFDSVAKLHADAAAYR